VTAGGAIGGTINAVIPMIVSELTPQKQRAAMLALVNSAMTFAGVIAPLAKGAVVQNAATQAAGYERGYLISGGLLVGGLIGLLFIRPERDRLELVRHALPSPSLQPLSG
jgi:ACS family D-galactonate transporter-like MFS transporter